MKLKTATRYLKSRTIAWSVIILPGIAAGVGVFEAHLGFLKDHLGPWQYVLFAAGIAAVNVWIRAVTTEALEKRVSDDRLPPSP